ncbi:MAG: phosphoribosylanthranilate isomerase [Verrucomicrobium sp.]|nr:phosphoribosylanthranilate isomerase [Verrucomicrobium sp.]
MALRIKICGITREEDARAAIEAGADALGFVFVPGTPRFIEPGRAAEITRGLPPFVSRVGLFVDADPGLIRAAIDGARLDTVQLHGEEPPEVGRSLRQRVRVVQAFRVRGPETLERLPHHRDSSDAWLLDAYVPGTSGGTGARFDWSLAIEACRLGHPVILAGGLKPDNIAEAVRQVRPYAVDVSSGVELAPGIKDAQKILRLVGEARKAAATATTDGRASSGAQR